MLQSLQEPGAGHGSQPANIGAGAGDGPAGLGEGAAGDGAGAGLGPQLGIEGGAG